ncbi:MAG TPA: biotin carboxylase N-terminal domain-containing protein [Candidatus Binataceae bacterium]|nr:biotin carboxylase N-terminal domain-containing protein [Candidatus Binataceae bacterium]
MPSRRIKKLLIANRGEIAVRIIRSARMMGIRTVAIFSAADSGALHVALADEAQPLGAPEPAQSYLNIKAILEAALAAGADAIHPGYGFLSERAEFAQAVADAGMTFVGPPSRVMDAVGDKLAARHLAIAVGVPVVPGLDLDSRDPSEARRFGEETGFPLLVKAAAGGGGRGMRVVETPADLGAALEAASREAAAAFGDGRVYLEKFVARPRHVEVQILGDNHGGIVALGERDCSIQRRHQKLVEESPAPNLPDSLRSRLLDAAIRLGRAADYRNAGTVEFLVAGDQFYFLEVNARLQVEHPLTELRFNRDLVADQLAIAMGEPVVEPGAPRGCAIECRINAEDAAHDFRPATGTIAEVVLPQGPGVRVDTYLTRNAQVTPYYDSLLAKLICWGEDREQARRRMLGALGEFALLGIETTAAFLADLIGSEAFAAAALSTAFIPEFLATWRPDDARLKAALLAAALRSRSGSATPAVAAENHPSRTRSPWTALGRFEPWSDR